MGMVVGPKPIDTNGLILYFDGSNPNDFVSIPGVGQRWVDPFKKHEGLYAYPTPSNIAFDYNYNALLFNGYSDYITITGKPELYLNETGFSIHYFICCPTYFTWAIDRYMIDIPGCFAELLWQGPYNQYHNYNIYGSFHEYQVAPFKQWVLLSLNATKSGSNIIMKHCLNGINLTNNFTYPQFSNYSSRNIYISSPQGPFSGHIGMIAMYNRPFSNTEMQNLYKNIKDKFKIPTTANTVKDGLVLHLDAGNPASYPGTGTTWYDLSGKNNHATLVGSPSPTYSSEVGGCILFDGVNNYASIPNSADLDLSQDGYTKQYTVVLTFKGTPINFYNQLLTKGSQYYINYDNGGIYSTLGTAGAGVPSNTWTSISYIYNNVDKVVYRDAHYFGRTRTGAITMASDSSDLRIVQYCNSSVAQLMIYNRVLSAAEILQNFNTWSYR